MLKRVYSFFKCIFNGHEPVGLRVLGGADLAVVKTLPSGIELARVLMCKRCNNMFWIPGRDVPEDIGNEIEYYEAILSLRAAALDEMGGYRNGKVVDDEQ